MFSFNTQSRSDKNMQIKCHFLSSFPFPIPSPLKVATIYRFLWWRIFSMECFSPRLGMAFKTTDFNLFKGIWTRTQIAIWLHMWNVAMASEPKPCVNGQPSHQQPPLTPFRGNKKSKSLLTSWNDLSRGKVFGVRLNGSCSCWLPEAQRKDHCLPGCQSCPFIHTYVDFTKQNKTKQF